MTATRRLKSVSRFFMRHVTLVISLQVSRRFEFLKIWIQSSGVASERKSAVLKWLQQEIIG